MKITVRVKPGSKKESVIEGDDGSFTVRVVARPEKGAANEAMRKAIARHFAVSPSRVSILAEHTAKTKIVEITPPQV